MSRFSPEPKSMLKRWSFLALPIMMGVVGWFAMRDGTGLPAVQTNPVAFTAVLPDSAASSSTMLLARVAAQKDRDDVFVYNVTTGAVSATTTVQGWRIPQATKAYVTRRSEDSAWVLVDGDWSVVLRDPRGNMYQDPLVVGEFDAQHVAIVAINSDQRQLLSVSQSGSIHLLASLSDQTVPLNVQLGRVWLVETAPQEGIETPPQGPSSVWSVDIGGASSTRLVDERVSSIISSVFVRGNVRLLATDQSDMRIISEKALSQPISGKPLGWVDDQHMLIQQVGKLCLLSTVTSQVICNGTSPEGVSWAQILP